MGPVRVVVLLAGLLWMVVSSAHGGDSVGYRGPRRDGIYDETNLLRRWPADGPKRLWTYDGLGQGWSAATVTADRVYITGMHQVEGEKIGHLYAFTIDGELLWRRAYGPEFGGGRFEGPRATPMLAGERIVLATAAGELLCFRSADGETIWSMDMTDTLGLKVPGWGYNETPLIVGEKVIVSTRRGNGALAAVALDDGRLLWTTPDIEKAYACSNSSAILVGTGERALVVHYLWRAIVALDPATGRVVWQRRHKAGGTLTPVGRDGLLFYCQDNGDGRMLARSEDGKGFDLLWEGRHFDAIGQAVILDGRLYIGGRMRKDPNDPNTQRRPKNRPRGWLCLDGRTGELIHQVPCWDSGSVVAADGLLYWLEGGEGAWHKGKVPRTRLSLVKPTPDGFKVVSRFRPAAGSKELWTNPTIAHGRLFFRHGRLLAVYDLRRSGADE